MIARSVSIDRSVVPVAALPSTTPRPAHKSSTNDLELNFWLVGWGEWNPRGQVQPGEPAQPGREHAHRQHPLSKLQVKTKPR